MKINNMNLCVFFFFYLHHLPEGISVFFFFFISQAPSEYDGAVDSHPVPQPVCDSCFVQLKDWDIREDAPRDILPVLLVPL